MSRLRLKYKMETGYEASLETPNIEDLEIEVRDLHKKIKDEIEAFKGGDVSIDQLHENLVEGLADLKKEVRDLEEGLLFFELDDIPYIVWLEERAEKND